VNLTGKAPRAPLSGPPVRAARERIRERVYPTPAVGRGPPAGGTDDVTFASTPLPLPQRECDRVADHLNHRMEAHVGDRSPKSKERDQKQKNAVKAESAAQAKSKQDTQNRATQIPGKTKK